MIIQYVSLKVGWISDGEGKGTKEASCVNFLTYIFCITFLPMMQGERQDRQRTEARQAGRERGHLR